MERLKHMKESLMNCVQGQMSHLDTVDTKELGEAIDMLKDLEEAMYYCTIVKAMEGEDKDKYSKHFVEYIYPYRDDYNIYPDRDLDRDRGRMYYNGNGNGHSSTGGGHSGDTGGGTKYYDRVLEWPDEMRDKREGKSWKTRKMYMESKEMHHDKAKQMKELEKYMQELSSDILEMIDEATPEEKQFLSSKISTLASKISPVK